MLCREHLQKQIKVKIFSNRGARARCTDPGSAILVQSTWHVFLAKEYKKAYIALKLYDYSHGDNTLLNKNLDYYFIKPFKTEKVFCRPIIN